MILYCTQDCLEKTRKTISKDVRKTLVYRTLLVQRKWKRSARNLSRNCSRWHRLEKKKSKSRDVERRLEPNSVNSHRFAPTTQRLPGCGARRNPHVQLWPPE